MDKTEIIILLLIVLVVLVGLSVACLFHGKNEAEDTLAIIDELRADNAASVIILCDYEDADTIEEQSAIEVRASWTNWNDRRFYGRSVLDALKKALQAKGEAQ